MRHVIIVIKTIRTTFIEHLYVPDIFLNIIYVLSHLVFTVTYFTDNKTKAQRGYITHQSSHSK